MKKLKKEKIIIAFMLLGIMLLPTTGVKAALQANPNTHIKKTDDLKNWMSNFRKMEATGGTMGLSETLNADLTSKESNNIDVHMMKSTEYGAIAILSASGYGNPQTLQNSAIKTTTGNKTGVYFTGNNWEWVAGGASGDDFSGINKRYYDQYQYNENTAKIGDALGSASTTNPGCKKWHSAGYWSWGIIFDRGGQGLFSLGSSDKYGNGMGGVMTARGVAVCGTGL